MQISNLKWKVGFTYNLRQLPSFTAEQRQMFYSFPITIPFSNTLNIPAGDPVTCNFVLPKGTDGSSQVDIL